MLKTRRALYVLVHVCVFLKYSVYCCAIKKRRKAGIGLDVRTGMTTEKDYVRT